MKLLVIVLTVFSCTTFAAQTKLPQPKASSANGFPAIECFDNAGPLSDENAAILCSGAVDAAAPINCFNSTGHMSDKNAAVLCSGARAGSIVP